MQYKVYDLVFELKWTSESTCAGWRWIRSDVTWLDGGQSGKHWSEEAKKCVPQNKFYFSFQAGMSVCLTGLVSGVTGCLTPIIHLSVPLEHVIMPSRFLNPSYLYMTKKRWFFRIASSFLCVDKVKCYSCITDTVTHVKTCLNIQLHWKFNKIVKIHHVCKKTKLYITTYFILIITVLNFLGYIN